MTLGCEKITSMEEKPHFTGIKQKLDVFIEHFLAPVDCPKLKSPFKHSCTNERITDDMIAV